MNEIPLSVLFSMLVVMLILSAFFSGSETSLMSLNRYRLKHLIKLKHKGAIKANTLLQRPDRLLSLILLGNHFVNNFAASIVTIIAIKLYTDNPWVIAMAMVSLTFIILICAEMTPKALATAKPEVWAFSAAWLYTPLLKIFYPIVWLLNGLVGIFLKILRVHSKKSNKNTLSKEELKIIIAEAEHMMSHRYQKMLMSILELESATVEDIMTPRNEIVGIDLEASIDCIVEKIKHSPHTRLPVYKKSIDRVVGILHLRKVLLLLNNKDFDKHTIISLLAKPTFIPGSTPVHAQMARFKDEKNRIGLVVDEYGDVEGLVTMDDLLQEIVGELLTDDVAVRKQNDGSFLVDANITLRELNRITQWSLPTEGPKTLNGLIIEIMETIPDAGICMDLYDYPIEIIKRDEHAVKLVKFLAK